MQLIAELFAGVAALEAVSVVLAVAYLVLVIRENIWCWPAALGSVVLSLVVFYDAKLYMESALQLFYAGMAVYGWREWRHGGRAGEGVAIRTWPLSTHLLALGVIAAATAVCGALLAAHTDAAYPFLDSFTTVAALVTTYMVAKKVLENWIYWFVIDSISVYLYGARGLFLFAGLFIGYLVLVVVGFRSWNREWRSARAGAEVASGGY